MKDERWFTYMRRRIQEALAESKRRQSRDEYDFIEEFERQFENAPRTRVRERIGNPPLPSLKEIPAHALEEVLDGVLDLLYAHNIVIDFLGEWDDEMAYRYITEELLDEEIDDIRIEDLFTHFTPTTPAYDVQFWVEELTDRVLRHSRDLALAFRDEEPLQDAAGRPLGANALKTRLETIWSRLPIATRVDIDFTSTEVAEDWASVACVVTWQDGEATHRVEPSYHLQPSPYYGWDIVQTSLIDDLLAIGP